MGDRILLLRFTEKFLGNLIYKLEPLLGLSTRQVSKKTRGEVELKYAERMLFSELLDRKYGYLKVPVSDDKQLEAFIVTDVPLPNEIQEEAAKRGIDQEELAASLGRTIHSWKALVARNNRKLSVAEYNWYLLVNNCHPNNIT